eukprot:TRINITY_DN6328_c0_g1_i1.p1 TRINITY_DN6328_c0_g1~~TRINITY_DN6328_c0_g1_i1.p1  ORF type:complete len:215 (+),score=35.78 TRINITY_DN6328_c0_g1_i1:68-712(+)
MTENNTEEEVEYVNPYVEKLGNFIEKLLDNKTELAEGIIGEITIPDVERKKKLREPEEWDDFWAIRPENKQIDLPPRARKLREYAKEMGCEQEFGRAFQCKIYQGSVDFYCREYFDNFMDCIRQKNGRVLFSEAVKGVDPNGPWRYSKPIWKYPTVNRYKMIERRKIQALSKMKDVKFLRNYYTSVFKMDKDRNSRVDGDFTTSENMDQSVFDE